MTEIPGYLIGGVKKMSDSGRCIGECRHGELRGHCVRCELDRREHTLKKALCDALLLRHKTIRTVDEADEDDITYTFTPEFIALARLGDLDLNQHDPFFFKD